MSLKTLQSAIIACKKCPRLVCHRERVAIRTPCDCPWRKPVAGFGDPQAALLIIGLALLTAFVHGGSYVIDHSPVLHMSYHPSPQNTRTGVLTPHSFQRLLNEIR